MLETSQQVQQGKSTQPEELSSVSKRKSRAASPKFLVKQRIQAQKGGLYQTLELLPRVSRPGRPKTAMLPPVPLAQSESLSMALIETFKRTKFGLGLSLSTLGVFFTYVPRRLGHNQTLDAAVACMVEGHQHLARREPRPELPSESNSYMKALRNLQRSLDDPKESRSPETLCGALVLACYEVRVS